MDLSWLCTRISPRLYAENARFHIEHLALELIYLHITLRPHWGMQRWPWWAFGNQQRGRSQLSQCQKLHLLQSFTPMPTGAKMAQLCQPACWVLLPSSTLISNQKAHDSWFWKRDQKDFLVRFWTPHGFILDNSGTWPLLLLWWCWWGGAGGVGGVIGGGGKQVDKLTLCCGAFVPPAHSRVSSRKLMKLTELNNNGKNNSVPGRILSRFQDMQWASSQTAKWVSCPKIASVHGTCCMLQAQCVELDAVSDGPWGNVVSCVSLGGIWWFLRWWIALSQTILESWVS